MLVVNGEIYIVFDFLFHIDTISLFLLSVRSTTHDVPEIIDSSPSGFSVGGIRNGA